MKLVLKLIAALVLGISAVMAFNTYLRLQGEVALFRADTIRDLRAMAHAVSTGVQALWPNGGQERAQEFVRAVNRIREDMETEWIWLDELAERKRPPRLDEAAIVRLRGGIPVTVAGEIAEGERRRYTFWPLEIDSPRRAALELSISLDTQRDFIEASQRLAVENAVRISLVCGALVAGVGYWFVGRPIRHLRDKARRVGIGDLSGPLALRQRDEIGELASELNAMCDRLEQARQRAAHDAEARIQMLEQLRHADRLKTVGQLASGVAHELGTPLTVVSGHAGMIRRGELSPEEVGASAEVIAEQTDRMAAIIRQLLDFSRRRTPTLTATDLGDVAMRTLEMLGPLADERHVALRFRSERSSVPVEGHPGQMQQAIANLVLNAIQASPDGGRVDVTIAAHGATRDPAGADGEFECISVTDHGVGIPPEHVSQVFEPFFTTKGVGEGTGLGLAVAYGIVREHGGWIDVESRVGEGSRFSVFLRRARNGGSGGATA